MMRPQKTWISGYRIVWLIVMFDLPVKEPDQRRKATQFRNMLLDEGFTMAQYSVYYRMAGNKERAASLTQKIGQSVPDDGSVNILEITDRQYGNIKVYDGKTYKPPEKPDQLTLF